MSNAPKMKSAEEWLNELTGKKFVQLSDIQSIALQYYKVGMTEAAEIALKAKKDWELTGSYGKSNAADFLAYRITEEASTKTINDV